jgi:GT2 family glycosyltransferase/glycosyltransferase involved in cell wall biosynthesis
MQPKTTDKNLSTDASMYLLSCKKVGTHALCVNVLISCLVSTKDNASDENKIDILIDIKDSLGAIQSQNKFSVLKSENKHQIATLNLELASLKPGKYSAEAYLAKLDKNTLTANDDLACNFDFEISTNKSLWINALPSYLSLISINSTEWTQPTILSVRGSVKNIGLHPWVRNHGLGSVKLGGILSSESNDEVQITSEYRYELPKQSIKPQESFDFIFIISIANLTPGKYELILDMVKEGDFWFRQFFGDSGSLLKFEINEKLAHTDLPGSLFISKNVKFQSTQRANLVFICPTLPEFDKSTGGKRLFTLLMLLRNLGYDVIYLYEYESERSEIYKSKLDSIGITAQSNPLGFLLHNSQDSSTVFIIGWYPCALRNIDAIKSVFPNNKIIIDSVDIHWKRNHRALLEGLNDSSKEQLEKEKLDEKRVYSLANEVWVVSETDQKELWAELPSCPTRVIPVPIDDIFEKKEKNQNRDILNVLFVGGFNHPPNISAAIWAVQICKRVHEKYNLQLKLHIIGSNPPSEVANLHNDSSVFVHGFVEDLSTFYHRAFASLVPLKFGAGVKGKVTEALSYGIPVITNHIGLEGLDLPDEYQKLTGETTEQLADCLAWSLKNNSIASEIAEKSFKILQNTIGKNLIEVLLDKSIMYPPVTIAIVTYNKLKLLEKCLDSLLKFTIHPNFRVAVWSNGCTDGTVEYLKKKRAEYPKLLDIHLNPTNEYFIKPNNSLFNIYDTDDIVLINNDIEFIDEKWLIALADAAYSSTTVACSGGLTISEDGLVLEAGARILPNGYGINEFRGSPQANPEISKFRYVGYSSGCFLYLRRDAINKVGLLDEIYYPMYFEDCDWQYRAHKLGLKTLFTPYAKAIHREGSSAGNDPALGLKQFQDTNRIKFIQRFASVLDDLQY